MGAGKQNLSCGRFQLGIPGSMFWEQREGAGRKGPLPLNQRFPVTAPWKLVFISAEETHQEIASEVRTVGPQAQVNTEGGGGGPEEANLADYF